MLNSKNKEQKSTNNPWQKYMFMYVWIYLHICIYVYVRVHACMHACVPVCTCGSSMWNTIEVKVEVFGYKIEMIGFDKDQADPHALTFSLFCVLQSGDQQMQIASGMLVQYTGNDRSGTGSCCHVRNSIITSDHGDRLRLLLLLLLFRSIHSRDGITSHRGGWLVLVHNNSSVGRDKFRRNIISQTSENVLFGHFRNRTGGTLWNGQLKLICHKASITVHKQSVSGMNVRTKW